MKTETKKPSAIETSISGSVLTLTFSNGETLVCDVAQFNDDISLSAKVHGAKQKLCDAGAISRDPTTGKSATIETKYEAVKEVFDRITAPEGTWNKVREGVTGGGSLLLLALIRLYAGARTKEQLVASLATKTDAEKAALRKNPKIAPLILAIQAERDADGDSIDSDELLESF